MSATGVGWASPPATASLLNKPRALEAMSRHGLAAIVATSPENVTYLTGYCHWPMYAHRAHGVVAALFADGTRTLIVPRDAAEYVAQCPPDDCELLTHGSFHLSAAQGRELSTVEQAVLSLRARMRRVDDPVTGICAVLAERGHLGDPVTLDAGGLSEVQAEHCRERLASLWPGDCTGLLRWVRRVKTEAEIALLRTAAQAVEGGIQAGFRAAAPGVTEQELERVFRTAVIAAGVAPGHCETNIGHRAGGCFPPTSSAALQPGDVIRSDCGGRLDGYWADTGRTASWGEPPHELARVHDALMTGMQRMLSMAIPGTPVAELATAGIAAVREAGVPSYRRHHVGHGIGLEMYEPPVLVAGTVDGDAPDVLCAGMVLNLELPYYELGLGGLQIEETVVIRDSGPELLTTAPRELIRCD